MTQKELTVINLGQSLDDLANLDPRGYGVCKIIYNEARQKSKLPLCMNAAARLMKTLKPSDTVYILTGFVLAPWGKAETDGMISSVLLCRALVKAFGVRPVLVCPEECKQAAYSMAPCVGLQICENLSQLDDHSIGLVSFTKDAQAAPQLADALIEKACPSAVISIECPGCNSQGRYHNATGMDVTDMQAKQDALFEKLQKKGILNIAIGDLGNEIGMGAVRNTLNTYIPNGTLIGVRNDADVLITATTSDWGCYAMIAALAFLMEDTSIMHTRELELQVLKAGSSNGLVDMYGQHIPAVDGFGPGIMLPVVELMGNLVSRALELRQTCKSWFAQVEELGYFHK